MVPRNLQYSEYKDNSRINPDFIRDLKDNMFLLSDWLRSLPHNQTLINQINDFKSYQNINVLTDPDLKRLFEFLNNSTIPINIVVQLPVNLFFENHPFNKIPGATQLKKENVYIEIERVFSNFKTTIPDTNVSYYDILLRFIINSPNLFSEDPKSFIDSSIDTLHYLFNISPLKEELASLLIDGAGWGQSVNNNLLGLLTLHSQEIKRILETNPGKYYEVNLMLVFLSQEDVFSFFSENSGPMTDLLINIEKSYKGGSWRLFKKLISSSSLRQHFINDPTWFLDLSEKNNLKIVLEALTQVDKDPFFFSRVLKNPATAELFFRDGNSVDSGSEVDRLYVNPESRRKKVESMSPEQILYILSDEPTLFFTSTNELLINKLKKDYNNFEGTFLGYLGSVLGNEYLSSERTSNLFMRLISQGRIYEFIEPEDTQLLVSLIVDSLFDGTDSYIYSFIDFIGKLSYIKEHNPNSKVFFDTLNKEFSNRFSEKVNERKNKKLFLFISYVFDPSSVSSNDRKIIEALLSNKTTPTNQLTSNNRLNVFQIFSPTETDFFNSTLYDFRNNEKMKVLTTDETPSYNRVVLESEGVVMTLFIGKNVSANVNYLNNLLKDDSNKMITFRGHSYQVEENFPAPLFINKRCNTLVLIGSCGSSHDIPSYLENAPENNYMIGYSGIGTGVNTNTIIKLIIEETKKDEIDWMAVQEKAVDKIGVNEQFLYFPFEWSAAAAKFSTTK
ncbi:hypothetical protein KO465_00585 [Candidatus Micrarchaeota archaeon]|nr:hypothetical protein [Candidatus Micrarchaeota archaeon]